MFFNGVHVPVVKSITEATNRNLFKEFPDDGKLVVVVPLNPIAR